MRAITRGQLALVYLCLLAGFTSCCDVSTFRGGEFSGCAKLDDNYDLYWKLEQQDIIFAFSVRNNIGGWIGLGISENGGMKGADIMVAQKVKGAYVMEDRFAQEYSLPQLDKHSDVTLISAEEDSDTTTIVFKRALVTCDGSQDNPISENVKWVIFAYGSGELQYHGASRGTREINFFEDIKPVLPSDSQVLSVLAPPFEVPAKETTYACSAHVLPHDQKYHIVHVNPLQRSSLVHHIVAYECHGPAPENITRAGTADCETDVSNSGACSCAVLTSIKFEYCGDGIFWVVWGLGGGPIDYAGDYAVPMGKDNTVYIKLEIHYYNPTGISGLVDSSGLEFTYTTQLRKYDLGGRWRVCFPQGY